MFGLAFTLKLAEALLHLPEDRAFRIVVGFERPDEAGLPGGGVLDGTGEGLAAREVDLVFALAGDDEVDFQQLPPTRAEQALSE